MPKFFEEMVAEAESEPFSGWNVSYLKVRHTEGTPSWDYKQKAREARGGHQLAVLRRGQKVRLTDGSAFYA